MDAREILREIDLINVKVKRLQGELFQFRYGITAEDKFFQEIIDEKKSVILIFLSGEKETAKIVRNFRHILIVCVSDETKMIIQKSSLRYIIF